jgi:thiol-disulfide isomerase/thioredoxin
MDMNFVRKYAKKWPMFLLVLTVTGESALADATLRIGDPAPKLQCGAWLQGEPVTEFRAGAAYVVEFWSTWCGPCRESIPHLNDLHNKYKDKGLTFIGQDCLDDDPKRVAAFVKQMGDKMTYRVAIDAKSHGQGKMWDTWMNASGQPGIPTMFLVSKDGRIAWIGAPWELDNNPKVIEQVLIGKYDFKKAAMNFAKREAENKLMTPMRIRWVAAFEEMHERKWDKALDDLAAAEELATREERESMRLIFETLRVRILIGKNEHSAAYKLAEKTADNYKETPMLQSYVATQIIAGTDIDKAGLELAEKLINRADKAANGKDAFTLDARARLLFLKGQKVEAIAEQAKAVALAERQDKQDYQDRLDSYKKGRLPEIN